MPEQKNETVKIIGDIAYKTGTRDQYNQQGSYDDKTLYWCTNTGELFKGMQPYGGGLRKIEDHTALSAKAEQVIYLEPDGSGWAYEYATDKWTQVIYPITTVIDATSTDEQVPTAKAVYDALQQVQAGDIDLSGYVTQEAFEADKTAMEDSIKQLEACCTWGTM